MPERPITRLMSPFDLSAAIGFRRRTSLNLLLALKHLYPLRLWGANLKKIVAYVPFSTGGFCPSSKFGLQQDGANSPPQKAMPVNTKTIDLAPVPQTDEYVATIKSRRSANIQPQVDGTLTQILVKSGDQVRAGQLLMTIDPLKQQAVVDQQRSTEAQKKAIFDYNKIELERQQQALRGRRRQQAELTIRRCRHIENSKADWESAKAARVTQQRELGLLQPDRALRRRRRRHSGARGRLRFPADAVDHGRRERGPGSLHLHSHRARGQHSHGPAGADRHQHAES